MNLVSAISSIDPYDFGGKYACTYQSQCNKCGETIEVSTQEGNASEYETQVYVRCKCGGSAHFSLPVN